MSRFLKKRPAQSPLEQLSVDQRARLIGWLKDESKTYSQVVKLLRESFGVATSPSALGAFYHRHAAEIVGPTPSALPLLAAGVSLEMRFVRPGKVQLSVCALSPGARWQTSVDGKTVTLTEVAEPSQR